MLFADENSGKEPTLPEPTSQADQPAQPLLSSPLVLRAPVLLHPGQPDFAAQLASLADEPAVYCIMAGDGPPMIGRTNVVGRRLRRLLRPPQSPAGSSRFLALGAVATLVAYWPVASRLEATLLLYQLALAKAPDRYLKLINLRLPTYIKLHLQNEFPRTAVTSRLTRNGFYFGPFRSRLSAEHFETRVLELFQVRRCQEDLTPALEHPGCIYGEMNQCLRPCQQAVSPEEYATEVRRLASFFETNGSSLAESLAQSREKFSAELQFEAALHQHKRLERVESVVREQEELSAVVGHHHGVAILPAVESNAVTLFFLHAGFWTLGHLFQLETGLEKPMSMDARLQLLVGQMREELAAAPRKAPDAQQRAEHLGLLQRWHSSSWRDGEWLSFPKYEALPYRKLVNAIARVNRGARP